MAAAREVLGTFRLREEKERPAFLGDFGWCTWDAFYSSVTSAKVRRGLAIFARGGFVPGFMILDDGWLDNRGDHLHDFPAHPEKFPGGLARVARDAKRAGVRRFGVWHALPGYWAGIDPEGPLAARYTWHRQPGNIRPWKPDEIRDLVRVDDADIARFYHDFHRHLREQGVDLVKVDGQASLERFTAGCAGRADTMGRWQEALQGAAGVHFRHQLIHCMANSSDVAYHLRATSVWRNSDDYFPRRGPEQQQKHVVWNAFNAVWSSGFAWPDWDMFQSHGIAAGFHAAARALSGGPVYVSDHPGQQDFALLRRLALPAADSVFEDPLHQPLALKIQNRRGPIGAIGLFHCWTGHEGRPVHARWRASDVPELRRVGQVVAYDPESGEVRVAGARAVHRDRLPPLGWRIWTLAPIGPSGAAPLGLDGLWAGAAGLDRILADTPRELAVSVRHRGVAALFWTDRPPVGIEVDGQRARARRREDGLVSVAASPLAGTEGPVEIRLRFRPR